RRSWPAEGPDSGGARRRYRTAMSSDIGLIGLGVMGQNLALNFADHGATVSVYNRTTSVTDEVAAGEGDRPDIVPFHSVADLVASLGRPRRVAPMVPAGRPVDAGTHQLRPRRVVLMVAAGRPGDAVIDQLLPHLDPGDIVIDGGNSLYTDTIERTRRLTEAGIRFVGCGISGGEEGARHGPSMMPGGDEEAWPHISELFQAVAAKAPDGTPCCDWLGPDGAGHYVKMVHNGIEYGDMQVIAEAYHLMKVGLGLSPDEMAAI